MKRSTNKSWSSTEWVEVGEVGSYRLKQKIAWVNVK